ncbi:LysM peptidoglycan-binding domain-containing protein [Rubritalea sp.]|uniref:LysM peptidoglycan-binding domain-containing protein n=1 Tax=Rubritalea sp. TaxID=2109375 RepID=UPI003EF7F1BC
MRVSTLIKFLAAVLVLSVLAGTIVIARRAFNSDVAQQQPANELEAVIPVKDHSKEAIEMLLSKLEVESIPDVTPGERAFEAARELLAKGDYVAAEEKLKYVNTYYPTAVSAPEARRILGEMNMDRLFSGKEFTKLIDYTVKRGDSFYKIVRDHNTKLDLVMFLNDMQRTDRLHPGDKFQLMELNLRLVIDMRRNVVSLWDGPRYIKGYEIKASNFPTGKDVVKTSVLAVEAQVEDAKVKLLDSEYRNAEKVVVIKNPQAELRPMHEKLSEEIEALYLDNSDMEEISLLLREGNSVEIRY